jgi:outer membrane lipoprotein LolB
MRALLFAFGCTLALAGCLNTRPHVPSMSADWTQRLSTLQTASHWQLSGRAAVAFGNQGWQASLDWRQNSTDAELHLAGPLGIGAQTIRQTANGLSLNGAPPSDSALAQLQDKLGFELPVGMLRYWLLGVPDPRSTAEVARNPQDRAAHLTQEGWSIEYDRYTPVADDVLPAHIVLTRGDVRVRIVADHWELK